MLTPIPFLQHLFGEGIAIGPTLRIEAGTWIAVPIPGAANIAAGLENPHRHAQPAQLVKLIHTGNAGTDDDGVNKFRKRLSFSPSGFSPWCRRV